MRRSSALHVDLVAPSVWQPFSRAAFADLGPAPKRLAEAVLRTLHNRHIGITPELAAALARLVLKHGATQDGVWQTVGQRLIAELAPEDARGRRLGHGGYYGLLWNAVPTYGVLRLVLPIVEAACRKIGHSFLFCEDDVATRVQRGRYANYAKNLEQALTALANDDDPRWALFWRDRAVTLSRLSRLGRAATGPAPVSESDPLSLAMFYRLRPQVPPITKQPRRTHRWTASLPHRPVRTQKEGGIDGIRLTRRAEDIDSILYSEFINHEAMIADRLANTGYLAYRRQPRREQLRDVLVAAILPTDFASPLSVDFVKTCWFDFTARLGHLLWTHGLKQSAFFWIESDYLARARARSFFLQDVPLHQKMADPVEKTLFYHGFLHGLGWLPFYWNRRDCFELVRVAPSPNGGDEDLLEWAFAAWHSRLKSKSPRTSEGEEHALDIATFNHVHLMLFLPTREADAPSGTELASLSRGFGLNRHARAHLSVTRVPAGGHASTANAEAEGAAGWSFQAQHQRGANPFFIGGNHLDPAEMAGQLEHAWLEQLTREIWRV